MRDILLQIDTYTQPTPTVAIDQAVTFAKSLGVQLSALATHIDIRVPPNWLAERLLHVSQLAETEESKSLENARAALSHFGSVAKAAGCFGEAVIARADLHATGACIAAHARTRDLCIVPVEARGDAQRLVAEDVVFGAGRPVLVFNPDHAPLTSKTLERVAVLWDASRCAARAVADAIPVLAKAQDVRVVTMVGEKAAAVSGLSADLVRHLKAYGIAAQTDEVHAAHRRIGSLIEGYVEEKAPTLLVMGAYGNSKMKEFVLGGATEHVLNHLRAPALLSH
jgi:nucleotide-binding universal stress UspA family protein